MEEEVDEEDEEMKEEEVVRGRVPYQHITPVYYQQLLTHRIGRRRMFI